MKKKQTGYYNMDFSAVFIGAAVIGILLGVLLSFGVPWLWELIKPLLHGLTAP